jgi:RyR domain
MERLAEAEHDGWTEQKYRDSWTHALVRDDKAKKHPCLVQYAVLSDEDKEKDCNAVRHYPDIVEKAGYEIVEAGSGSTTRAAQRRK